MATVRALISARSAGLPGAFPFSGCGWIMNATCSPSLSASSTLVEEIRCASRTLLPGPTTQALVPRACYPKTADRGVSSNFGASDRACPRFRTDRSPVQPARKARLELVAGGSLVIFRRDTDAVPGCRFVNTARAMSARVTRYTTRRSTSGVPTFLGLNFHWRQCHRAWRVVPRAVTSLRGLSLSRFNPTKFRTLRTRAVPNPP